MTEPLLPRPRKTIQKMQAYVPGEQPREENIVKLNTNEFPYPPAPEVLEAIRAEATESVRRYPNPTSQLLREALSETCGLEPSNILVGNGSDENLRLLVQAYLDPGETMAVVDPTYSLYPVLAEMFDGRISSHPVDSYGHLPQGLFTNTPRMFMIANPNPPIGTQFEQADIKRLAKKHEKSLLVIDEAYVAFAGQDCLPLLREQGNVVISRTFSKSHGMAGMRVGYVAAHPAVIETLDKIRDSYNVNRVSQAAALAAVKAVDYYTEKCRMIVETRERLRDTMVGMGYEVPASAGNFIFARSGNGLATLTALRERNILVRYFDLPGLRDGVRITIGTDDETNMLIEALRQIPAPNEVKP